ncbi:MAG: hypothetical protein EPO32_05615 [Anaerolineae bacterium]|nr:MAG: hypothetical protein EPO32_05615 [Anaerolineae bacterium]
MRTSDSTGRLILWTLILILSAILVGLWEAWYYGFLFRRGIGACSPPPTIMVDGSADAEVHAWIDANSDGVRDLQESPLEGVVVHLMWSEAVTDSEGAAYLSEFLPGCACDCGSGEEVSAKIPAGYRNTTPIRYPYIEKKSPYMFGFILEDSSSQEPIDKFLA